MAFRAEPPLRITAQAGDVWELGPMGFENGGAGVTVSALGLNGAQITHAERWRSGWPQDLLAMRADLLIFAFGTNEAFDPRPDPARAEAAWARVLDAARRALPRAGLLLLGAPDDGSVIPFFIKKKKEGIIPITDMQMTRFNISLQGGVDMVMHALFNAWGGELFVPKIPSYHIGDVAKAIAPECEHRVIGIRPGEKIHEEMISVSDAFYTYDLGKYYVILPTTPRWNIEDFIKEFNAKKVSENFSSL